ncbi:MAG: DMT family transporter [Aestuariivirga sp.]|uniref:DMT family transporter n=1 Tax=Aestuariivirga sp. TaxID=2650926 RepID=UPI0025BABA40|nr:DMT family transporter [Aestuariivirga sp.]MCA3561271.1 DMT family transporter [Aestuariivirga sp.]
MTPNQNHIPLSVWGMLLLLSVIWGGSYLFVGIAVKDLSPLVIVWARVALAASALLPVHLLLLGPLPKQREAWTAIIGLSVLNNVIPFTLIVTGQTMIASGLASVINATSPLFGVAVIAAAGIDPLIPRKVLGILIGIVGVAVLKGASLFAENSQSLGILLCLGAAASYGVGSLWARMKLKDTPPLSMATGQLLCSSAIMTVLAFSFDNPAQLLAASRESWAALLGLSLLSTSFAYILFFRVVARSGPANVLLVTMIIPVSAIALGYMVLGETLDRMEILGTLIIMLALVVIDGRAIRWLRPGDKPA